MKCSLCKKRIRDDEYTFLLGRPLGNDFFMQWFSTQRTACDAHIKCVKKLIKRL